jgi:signal transduction histidine kinase
VILEQANRMTTLIRQLLDFSRRQGPRFGLTSLRAIGTRAVDLLGSFARKRDVTLELQALTDPLLVAADEHQIQQVLTNIIMNGIQATPGGGRVTVTVETRETPARDGTAAVTEPWVCVVVQDSGVGITPDDLPRIFEPFFTTKGVGEGTGLGLSVAYGIVHEHGGRIDVESELGRGSRFSVLLPLAGEATRRAHEVAS